MTHRRLNLALAAVYLTAFFILLVNLNFWSL